MRGNVLVVMSMGLVSIASGMISNEDFVAKLQRSVGNVKTKLSNETLHNLSSLRDSIAEIKQLDMMRLYSSLTRNTIRRGIVTFMDQRANILGNSRPKKECTREDCDTFKRHFQQLVLEPCHEVKDRLGTALGVFSLKADDEALLSMMDTESLQWLVSTKICHLILNDFLDIFSYLIFKFVCEDD